MVLGVVRTNPKQIHSTQDSEETKKKMQFIANGQET